MAVLVAAFLLGTSPGLADAPAVPHHGDARHLGVASCASSTCHGAAEPTVDGPVLQNEYTTWQTRDKHALAYNVLLSERSQRMARNLGLGRAETADLCLDCHADNVPPARRGPGFQLTDGVGCESCHGGAEGWIGIHTVGDDPTSHGRNVAAGLYPTEDPKARATLCLSCHFGDPTKFVNHRLMGAGHPRLSFELDTFTAIEPAHFVVDDDYRVRKQVTSGVQTWAIGQALALAQTLEASLDPARGRDGLFPELVLFDCHACHKPMSAGTWRERASLGLGPGVVRFNDANLIMLRIAAETVSPELGRRVRERGRALHRASQGGQDGWVKAAKSLRAVALEAGDTFAAHRFTEPDLRALLERLVAEGGRGEYIDYVAGEQTTMAVGAVLQAMNDAGYLAEGEYDRLGGVMNDMYATVEQDERYRPSAHLAALRRLQGAAR